MSDLPVTEAAPVVAVVDPAVAAFTAALQPFVARLEAVEAKLPGKLLTDIEHPVQSVETLAEAVKAKLDAETKAVYGKVASVLGTWTGHMSVGAAVYTVVRHFLLPWLP